MAGQPEPWSDITKNRYAAFKALAGQLCPESLAGRYTKDRRSWYTALEETYGRVIGFHDGDRARPIYAWDWVDEIVQSAASHRAHMPRLVSVATWFVASGSTMSPVLSQQLRVAASRAEAFLSDMRIDNPRVHQYVTAMIMCRDPSYPCPGGDALLFRNIIMAAKCPAVP
jgi:hypothetical protein